jgi:membrane protease YdiL (CAAX protease family)
MKSKWKLLLCFLISALAFAACHAPFPPDNDEDLVETAINTVVSGQK